MDRIPGWIYIAVGLVLGLFSGLVIDGDMKGSGGLFGTSYNYQAPFTAHELLMLLLVLVSVVLVIVGIVFTVKNRKY